MLLFCFSGLAQSKSKKFNILFGEEFRASKRSTLDDIIGYDASGIYALKKTYRGLTGANYDLDLEHYDNNMNQTTLNYLFKAITSTSPTGIIKTPSLQSLLPGTASGILVGGNLSMLISAIGTPYEVDTGNKILFLEEVNESLEVIDNHLMQLKLSGKLRHLKGLILGQLINCRDTSGSDFGIADVIYDVFGRMGIPVIHGFPSGHQGKDGLNITLPFGVTVTLDADTPQLIIHGAGVSE